MIKLRYFASLRELIGSAEEEVFILEGSSVESLLEVVKSLHDPLKDVETIMVAINGKYAQLGASIEEGDVVALFPPVSGG